MSGKDDFLRELHRALTYLYDPGSLRRSPLVAMFGAENEADPAATLRRILVDAVEALRPSDGVPPTSTAWRAYHVLLYRFIESFTQQQVAADMATSTRQLRRHERAALEVLADWLCSHYQIENATVQPAAPVADAQMGPSQPSTDDRERELEWLKRTIPTEATDLPALLRAVLTTAGPLLRTLGVTIENRVPASLPGVAAQAATLRQALLNLVTTAARSAPGGDIRLSSDATGKPDAACVRLTVAVSVPQGKPWAPESPLDFEMARELLHLSGGTLETSWGAAQPAPASVVASVTLPVAQQTPVLVIDDNVDTLQLMERYLAGSRYRFIGASEPEEGLHLADLVAPAVVVLDVMMPGLDGWDLLGRLREHPRTRGVPIVVCTILPEEQLALALGAAEFLHKPVSPEALLKALDRLVAEVQGCR